MEIRHNNLLIRDVVKNDAEQICAWWNNGTVMAHAGFPNGLGVSIEEVSAQIERNRDGKAGFCMILFGNVPIGEMNWRTVGEKTCEIGIKICEEKFQNRGLGKIILRLFIHNLFTELGYEKIVLDTNLSNTRAQHVYEQLGFKKIKTNRDSWTDQLGNKQSSVEYELQRE